MSGKVIELPALIAGEKRELAGEVYRFGYDSGIEVVLPKPVGADARLMASTGKDELRAMPLDDITAFFAEVGARWSDVTNPWRSLAAEMAPLVTGYARKTVEADIATVADSMQRHKQYDFLATDLGDPGLLDHWAPDRGVYRRLWPKGVVTHVMVGNVPLASLFALYRSLVTKNVTIVKLPRRDTLTALCFALCIHETDPRHPVSRALSALYWEPESEFEASVIAASDVVSVWGRDVSVSSIKSRIPAGVDFVEFGPKRSFAVLLDGITDWDDVARHLAFDVAMYDQEGCFSVQEVYVQGDATRLAQPLGRWLASAAVHLPRRELGADGHAHIHRARLEAVARGWSVCAPEGTDWTVIVTDQPTVIEENPLARTVFVHPIRAVDQIVPLVDREVQTVSLAPWERADDVRDLLTAHGADRIVPVGRTGQFRPGFLHDGFEPLRRLVRWSTVERPLSYKYRFAPPDAEAREEARLTEFLGAG